jgi:hypothetical protein
MVDRLNIPAPRRPQAPRGHVPPEHRQPHLAEPLLDQIRLRRHDLADREQQLHLAVVEARHHGASWQQIADVLNLSVKAAWKRYVPV